MLVLGVARSLRDRAWSRSFALVAFDGLADTAPERRAQRLQVRSAHRALVRAVGEPLPAYRTAFGLIFDGRSTPEQSHASPFIRRALELCAEPGDGPWIQDPIRGVRRRSAQAQHVASAGPTSPRTAAQLVRVFERSRASIAKLVQISDGSLKFVRGFGWSSTAVASAVSSSSGIASRSCCSDASMHPSEAGAPEQPAASSPLRGDPARPRAASTPGRTARSRDHGGSRAIVAPRWQSGSRSPMGSIVQAPLRPWSEPLRNAW